MLDKTINDLSGIDKYVGSFDQDELGVTQIPTETIRLLNNFTLLALFTFLASCPCNWKLNAKHLAKHFDCNKDKIYKAIDGLIEKGLLTRTQIRNKGQFVRYHYRLHLRQKVQSTPSPEKPDTVKPDLEKIDKTPCLENTDLAGADAYKTKIIKNKKNNIYIQNSEQIENKKIDEKKPVKKEPALFDSFKNLEENNLKHSFEKKTLEEKKSNSKRLAIQNERVLDVFNVLWLHLNVTIEEAYDACQEYWDTKDSIATWGVFINFLKNPINQQPFQKVSIQKENSYPVQNIRETPFTPEQIEQFNLYRQMSSYPSNSNILLNTYKTKENIDKAKELYEQVENWKKRKVVS